MSRTPASAAGHGRTEDVRNRRRRQHAVSTVLRSTCCDIGTRSVRSSSMSALTTAVRLTFGQTRLNVVDRTDISLPFAGRVPPSSSTAKSTTGSKSATSSRAWELDVPDQDRHRGRSRCLPAVGTLVSHAVQRDVRSRHLGRRAVLLRPRPDGEEAAVLPAARRLASSSRPRSRRSRDRSFVGNEIFDLFEFCPNEQTIYRDIFAPEAGSLPPSTTHVAVRCETTPTGIFRITLARVSPTIATRSTDSSSYWKTASGSDCAPTFR